MRALRLKRDRFALIRDVGIVGLSIFIAVLSVQSGALASLIAASGSEIISSFIAGFFFTSIFTTAPAIAALGEIALFNSLYTTAFFGALGAMCGDYLIFAFVRDALSEHILSLTSSTGVRRRMRMLFKLKFFRLFTFFLGGLIIASPLPDELGLSLLGFSQVKTSRFFILSFVANFLGILLIGWGARALV